MSLTYDQRSELRYAFEDAYVEPDRRRACRVEHKVPTRLARWQRSGSPLEVVIEDFSTTGVGLTHREPLKLGERFLLEVPRRGQAAAWLVLRVVRCVPMDDGRFGIGMEMTEILDAAMVGCNPFEALSELSRRGPRVTAPATKLLFLGFGIVGTAVSALVL